MQRVTARLSTLWLPGLFGIVSCAAAWAVMPLVFELDVGQLQPIKLSEPAGPVERSLRLVAVREFYWPLLAVAGGYHYAIPGQTMELDASRSLAQPGRRIVRYQWRLHDGRHLEGPRVNVTADRPGLFSEELRLVADDGSEDRDFAQLRVWNTNFGAAFAAGWFYHWPLRGARPGTPVLFWNRLFGTTGPVVIDFGDDSDPVRIGQEITHAYRKAGLYTAALRSRGPSDEPVEVRLRVVIDP